MTLSDYTRLKQQIVIGVGTSERHTRLFTTLKDLFKGEINSLRRFEQIKSIGQLLNVLETREVLSEDNVGPLKQIAQRLPNNIELMREITQYETSHIPRDYTNYYVSENVGQTQGRPLNDLIMNGSPYGAMSEQKKQRILLSVVEEIGNSWRDLARNLKVREYEINSIDNGNKSIPMKALCMLNLYLMKKAEPDKWVFDLCDALDNTRRKDLTKAIKKILLSNM